MGIQEAKRDDPPPYSPRRSSSLDSDSESVDNDAARKQIEPLRRILAYILGADYKTFSVKPPPVKEWDCFRRLSRVARKLSHEQKEGFHNKDEARDIGYFYYHVTLPAKALGLPVDVVHEMLISYPFDMTVFYGAYAWRFCRGFGDLRLLARKLLIDREVMIDAVVDRPYAREQLKRANRAIEEKWFTSLGSPDEYDLADRGMKLAHRLCDPERGSGWFSFSRRPGKDTTSRESKQERGFFLWWSMMNEHPSPEDSDFIRRCKEARCQFEADLLWRRFQRAEST